MLEIRVDGVQLWTVWSAPLTRFSWHSIFKAPCITDVLEEGGAKEVVFSVRIRPDSVMEVGKQQDSLVLLTLDGQETEMPGPQRFTSLHRALLLLPLPFHLISARCTPLRCSRSCDHGKEQATVEEYWMPRCQGVVLIHFACMQSPSRCYTVDLEIDSGAEFYRSTPEVQKMDKPRLCWNICNYDGNV